MFNLCPDRRASNPGLNLSGALCKNPHIVENLLMLAEEMIVMWAKGNLQSPEFSCVALVPEERRGSE